MSSEQLGRTESVAIALGGMIGGGIYAVLGVVAGITGPATWAPFVLAGVVALCAAYAFDKLARLSDDSGGSVTFVRSFVGNATLAGMTGWTLLFGYVGSMAMYAFAFAEFALWFDAVPTAVAGLPLRPVLSVAVVAAFVGLNLAGARATGSAETVLVVGKVGILLAFGVLGLVYATTLDPRPVATGLGRLAGTGPVVGAAVSFVAFQGWQLLYYDQGRIEDPVETIRQSVYFSIPAAVAVYVLVAVVTVTLVPEALAAHPHTALVAAARRMATPLGLAGVAAVAISASALLSTGSAINATLFSAAHLARRLLSADLLPDQVGDGEADGVPERAVVVLGGVTALFTAVGSLGAITAFASLAFVLVFGGTSYVAFRQREADIVSPVVTAVGTAGSLAFFSLMGWHLYTEERATFVAVLAIAAAVLALEFLYFEREPIAAEARAIEPDALSDADG